MLFGVLVVLLRSAAEPFCCDICLDQRERIKIFPIQLCSFTLFKNNVKLDPILWQPKEFLRKPKTRDKKKILRKIRGGRLKYLGFAIL